MWVTEVHTRRPERWSGQRRLKKKSRPGGELMRTRRSLGEMTMRVEGRRSLSRELGAGTS